MARKQKVNSEFAVTIQHRAGAYTVRVTLDYLNMDKESFTVDQYEYSVEKDNKDINLARAKNRAKYWTALLAAAQDAQRVCIGILRKEKWMYVTINEFPAKFIFINKHHEDEAQKYIETFCKLFWTMGVEVIRQNP